MNKVEVELLHIAQTATPSWRRETRAVAGARGIRKIISLPRIGDNQLEVPVHNHRKAWEFSGARRVVQIGSTI